MANVLRRTLKSDRTPDHLRDPQNWPPGMREEWGDDEGHSAAARHRTSQVEAFRAARRALDEFKPDFVLIWGDDQYENFKVDLLTPFCVFALEEVPIEPFKPSDGLKASANVWNEPTDTVVKLRGHIPAATTLANELVRSGFDVSCSFKLSHTESLSHAFTRTVLYLDYDRKGFDYPVIPFHVNCYGSELRVPRGELPQVDGQPVRPLPSPPPWRCYDLGKQVAKILGDSPWRAAIIGSSSWSHGTLTAKHSFLYPDIEADRRHLAELRSGHFDAWRELESADMRSSGQHEMLNWVCLAGAMAGREPNILAYSETYLFNSDKVLALFPEPAKVPA
ncbi:MAG TPA: extradiol ring-cleavage dioxygenase [Chloroflexota bacterium]|nr:extradiol ring-cleavage dioxygenase [Chloroflexota bacterium]